MLFVTFQTILRYILFMLCWFIDNYFCRARLKCKNFKYIPIRYTTIVANFILLKLPIYMHMEFLLKTICANHGTILIFLSKSNEMQFLFTFLLFYCDGQYIIIIRCTKCIWYFRNVILQVLTLFWGHIIHEIIIKKR